MAHSFDATLRLMNANSKLDPDLYQYRDVVFRDTFVNMTCI
jgi:hypothetical protein